jgi:hypothetical protein
MMSPMSKSSPHPFGSEPLPPRPAIVAHPFFDRSTLAERFLVSMTSGTLSDLIDITSVTAC